MLPEADCPMCGVEMRHYQQPYALGGLADVFFCPKPGHYSVTVAPMPSETLDPFVATAPGSRSDEWAPNCLVNSDIEVMI